MSRSFNPFPFQRYTIERMINEKHLGLFYRMGAGKTVITLTALNELIYNRFEVRKALIIAPKYVAQDTWTKEVGQWDHLKLLRVVRVLGSEKMRLKALNEDADVYVINRENVAWLVKTYPGKHWPFDTVIFDELSSFKNPSAIRFKRMKKMLPLIERTYGLTGTPNANGYLNLWSEVYLLDQGQRLGRTFTAYRNRFFEPDKRGYGVVYNYKLKPGAQQEIDRLISDICISLKPSDYAALPPILYKDAQITLSDSVRRQYERMERELLIQVPDGIITAQTGAVVTGKLLQIASGAVYDTDGLAKQLHSQKVDALKEIIEGANGESVLVFYNFKHERERVLAALKGYTVRDISDESAIDDWNDGKVDVMLAHPASAAYGLNLQAGGHIVVWFSPTWNLEYYEQANARLYRTGQTEPVTVVHLIAQGTVDEDVMAALKSKDATQRELLEALQRRVNEYEKN